MMWCVRACAPRGRACARVWAATRLDMRTRVDMRARVDVRARVGVRACAISGWRDCFRNSISVKFDLHLLLLLPYKRFAVKQETLKFRVSICFSHIHSIAAIAFV